MFFLPLIAGNPYGVGNWTNRWIWSSYSDLTRPHPKWWYSKGNPLISGKSGLVKYLLIWPDECPEDNGTWGKYFSFERCFSAAFTHPTRQWDSQVHSELDHFAFLSRGSTLILRRNVRWRIERQQLWLISWMSTKCIPQKKSGPYFLEGLAPLASHEHVLWLVFALLLPPLLRNLIWSVL